jgi:putative tryptophan/tyrosine transport system substrate-binding protein
MSCVMERRAFISLLGGAAAAFPLVAHAQRSPMPTVGMLFSESLGATHPRVSAVRQGLSEVGFVEGRNIGIEYRFADGSYERLPALAADLVGRQVAVIVAIGANNAVLAAKAATETIPIVFTTGSDPIESGLVASLNRPGGNLTGLTVLSVELVPKKLELLREVVPTATVIGVLVNPTNANVAEAMSRDLQAAARSLGLQLHILGASSEREIEEAFATLARQRAQALLVGPFSYFNTRTEQIAGLTLRYRIPAVFQNREFAAAGGLMSYGGSGIDMYRQAGVYAGQILKGAKPSQLPVQQVTKVELIINLRTAKALGLAVPATLLARADEVIE